MSEQPPPPPPPPYGYGYYPPQQYGYGGYPPQHYWPPPPPPVPARDLKPSRLWYWLSGIPLLVGTILGIIFLVVFIQQLDPDIDSFRSNRAAEVELQSGDRAIYIQTRARNIPLQVPPGDLRCNVSFVGSDSQAVRLERTSSSTLDVGDDSFASEFKFDAPRDGPYRVICEGPEGVLLAIGPHLSFGLFASLLLAIALFGIGAILTIAGLIVTAIRRSNHKQRLQRQWRESQASGRT